MRGLWRARRVIAALLASCAALVFTGCASVTPHAVANHDDKVAFHHDAVAGMLTDAVFATLVDTENFSSVGYVHAVSSTEARLHSQQETYVLGNTWWSRESTDEDGMTIDTVHIGGSSRTFYLFGERYLPVSTTPWVSLPEGDLPRDVSSVCGYPSVWYLCGIAQAWQVAYDAHPDTLPVLVEQNADGTTHLASALTLRSIVDARLFAIEEGLASSISDETYETLLPLHVWFDGNGLVTKAEVNGKFGTDPELQLQLGFELTGEPTIDDRPTDPATLDQQYVTAINDTASISAFWQAIGDIRVGG